MVRDYIATMSQRPAFKIIFAFENGDTTTVAVSLDGSAIAHQADANGIEWSATVAPDDVFNEQHRDTGTATHADIRRIQWAINEGRTIVGSTNKEA
jgi:hypothetical protein